MEDLLRSLGLRIRELRLDVHRTWMGQIERGKNISVNTLANIADGLGVTLSTLFAGVERGASKGEAGKAAPTKTPAHIGPPIRAGQHTVQVFVEELRAERAALERTVATLREVALDRRPKRKAGSKR
jgi:transcriptional regulator with XRE-family HTH domain